MLFEALQNPAAAGFYIFAILLRILFAGRSKIFGLLFRCSNFLLARRGQFLFMLLHALRHSPLAVRYPFAQPCGIFGTGLGFFRCNTRRQSQAEHARKKC